MHAPSRPARTLLLGAATFAPAAAQADQYLDLDMAQARAALARLRAGGVVRRFCAPCGDARSERMTIRTLRIDRMWDRDQPSTHYRFAKATCGLVEITIRADLAYVHVREGRRRRNLAPSLGLQARRPRDAGARADRQPLDVPRAARESVLAARRPPRPVPAPGRSRRPSALAGRGPTAPGTVSLDAGGTDRTRLPHESPRNTRAWTMTCGRCPIGMRR